jgi:hypothetical protein
MAFNCTGLIRARLVFCYAIGYILPRKTTYIEGNGMPIKEGKRYCINHPKARMNRTESFKALVNIKGSATEGTINASSGLIVMPFVCEECGYLELYVADKTQNEKK